MLLSLHNSSYFLHVDVILLCGCFHWLLTGFCIGSKNKKVCLQEGSIADTDLCGKANLAKCSDNGVELFA